MVKKIIPFLVAAFLLTMAVAWDFFSRDSISNESVAQQISDNLNDELNSLDGEVQKISTDTAGLTWSTLKHSFFLVNDGRIVKWSNNHYAFDITVLASDFEFKLLQTSREDLLLYKSSHGNQFTVAVIPLRTGYEIVNRYLTTSLDNQLFPSQGIKIFPVSENTGALVCSKNHGCLFRIKILDGAFFENWISLVLTLLAIAFSLLGIYFLVRDQHRRRNYFLAFLLLFGFLAVVRIAMVQFLFPGRWIYAEFFDPKYFASSFFNASLGDFFLNALIVTVASVYLFAIFWRLSFVRRSYTKSLRIRIAISAVLLAASFFSFLFPHLFVESIFHDSAISMDITSGVEFGQLRVVAFGALILGCISSFLFVYWLLRWVKFIVKPKRNLVLAIFVGAFFFLAYFQFSELNYWTTFLIGLIFFSWLIFSNQSRPLLTFNYQTFSFLMITLVAYGAQGALGIKRFAEEKEISSMFRSAGNLINRDVLGEYLLSEAVKKIADDKFIVSSLANPLFTKSGIRQKVRQAYLNSYFDRYEVKVNLYYADGNSVDNESEDFANSIRAYENETNKTAYEGIYFVRNAVSENIKRYLAVVPIKNNRPVGYVVLDLSSNQIVPQQVYPELLVDNRFSQSLRNKNYSYAFFKQKKLIGSIGTFNFEREFKTSSLTDPVLFSKGIEADGNWLVGVDDETGKQAVVSSAIYPFLSSLANFSFLFVLGISLILITLIVFLLIRWRKRLDLNYSTRIQLYIYLSFILPLVVVSTIALRMISQSNELQLETEIREKGLRITESISDLLTQTSRDNVNTAEKLQSKLTEVSQNTLSDVNLYSPSGLLVASSQPIIFKSQLVMPLIDRGSLEKIVYQQFNIVQARCHIGLLDYNSLFFGVKPSGKNELIGILEIPFFQSNPESSKVSVLTNILVTFTAVFILFSFFAFTAINKLTRPLRFIAKRLKTTSLGNNQPIEWTANDEIGLMVKEYNRMLENLERNKIDLARIQKESAWREIAQQVAHEIKNPLTPMKLVLQQLELAMIKNDTNQDRVKKSIQTLLAQVEILNGIASSFNSFATLPAPVMSRIDINAMTRSVAALFENQTNGVVRFNSPSTPIFILGDERLLFRIFSNLVLNGIQSRSTEVVVLISIELTDEFCLIKFSDNGSGIAKELHDKIFLPNFTTKQSGSGLGLAIAKQGIEQMGGAIWFDSEEEKGSTFFVKLAIVLF